MTCAEHDRVEPVRDCLACRTYMREVDGLRAELLAVAVPPDDDLAARRLRGELLARARGARRAPRWRWLAAGLIGAAAVIAVVTVASSRDPAPAAKRDPIRIEADGATWSRLDTGDTTIVRLDAGVLRIRVDHHRPWHRLVVRLPDGEIDDVGTTFRVAVEAGHVASVAVEEGAVILRRGDGDRVALVRGDRWTAQVAIEARTAATRPSPTEPSGRPQMPVRTPGAADPIATAIDRLDHHDPAAAAAQLRGFVAHRAGDPRRDDAAYLLIIALQRIPDPDGARMAARDYLREFPDGLRRHSVEPLAH